MSGVRHLVAHDLRAHRGLLTAWVAVVIAHPLVSMLPWPAFEGAGIAVPLFLVGSRLALGAAALATIIQADSPLDDRTFWRTRPVRARIMAASKLVIGALMVATSLLVVLVVGVIVRVPVSHLPSTIAQVVVTDAAAVGLAMCLAARTRSIPTMLIALLGMVAVGNVLLFAITETLRVPWVRHFYEVRPPSPQVAVPTMLAVAALVSWTITVLVFLGERYRLRLLLLGATGVLMLATIWFVPAARLHRPPPRFERMPSLSVDGRRVHAERLESGRIALIADGTMTGVKQGDRTRQSLSDGTFDTPLGSLPAREIGDLRFLRGRTAPHAVVLGVMSNEQFARLAGRPIRFAGQFTLEVSRTDVVGTLPLAPGALLDMGDLRLRIRAAQSSIPVPPSFRTIATADVTWTTTFSQAGRLPLTQWLLRQGSDRRVIFRFANARPTWLVLLPSLAQPFGWQQTVLAVPAGDDSAIDTTSSTLEIEQTQGPVQTQQRISVDFAVPSTTEPIQASSVAR